MKASLMCKSRLRCDTQLCLRHYEFREVPGKTRYLRVRSRHTKIQTMVVGFDSCIKHGRDKGKLCFIEKNIVQPSEILVWKKYQE